MAEAVIGVPVVAPTVEEVAAQVAAYEQQQQAQAQSQSQAAAQAQAQQASAAAQAQAQQAAAAAQTQAQQAAAAAQAQAQQAAAAAQANAQPAVVAAKHQASSEPPVVDGEPIPVANAATSVPDGAPGKRIYRAGVRSGDVLTLGSLASLQLPALQILCQRRRLARTCQLLRQACSRGLQASPLLGLHLG